MMTVREINADQTKTLLSDCASLLVLDKRDAQSYRQGHISEAILAHDALIETVVRKGEKNNPILIYCYQGVSSLELARFFVALGFQEVYSLAGGYAEWKRVHG